MENTVCGNIGVGAVGAYWTMLQRRAGADVLVYDTNERRAMTVAEDYGAEAVSLEELLEHSDWVSVSVLPLKRFFEVMRAIGENSHLLRRNSLLLDHSGVKTGNENALDAMLKRGETFTTAQIKAVEGRNDVEAISAHLAFRPDVEPEGQNVYVSPLKPEKGGLWLPRVTGFLEKYGANVFIMTPEQQDLVTLRHQMIVWAALFAAFDAIRRSGSDMPFPEMERYATKLSGPFFDLMKRMVSGNARVYWDTMHYHPSAIKALSLLEQSTHILLGQLVQRDEAGRGFVATYEHLKAIAESSSPERKTGRPVMVELYYEHRYYERIKEALGLQGLPERGFDGEVTVSMIDTGRINRLLKANIPVASYTGYAYRDRRRIPEIAFHVRNTPHPEHRERKGMRFSPIIPMDLERAQQISPDYTRVQLHPLHPDPIVNFFLNISQDPKLAKLGPFVVYKPI